MLGIISESELLLWAYLWQCREHHAIWRHASINCETCKGGVQKGAVFSGDMKHEVVNAREIQGANKMK